MADVPKTLTYLDAVKVAAKAECTPATVQRWARGERVTQSSATRIERAWRQLGFDAPPATAQGK